MRKAIRRGSEAEEVRKHQDHVTGAWKRISKQRRRVNISYDPSMVTALQHGTRMDEEDLKKTCFKINFFQLRIKSEHFDFQRGFAQTFI